MSDAGKGDKPRPVTDRPKYDSEYDRIFKKDKKDAKD